MLTEAPFDAEEAARRQTNIIEARGPKELGQLHELIIVVTRLHMGESYDSHGHAEIDLHSRNGQPVIHIGQHYSIDHLLAFFGGIGETPLGIESTARGRFRACRVRFEADRIVRGDAVHLDSHHITSSGYTIWIGHLTTPIKN